jgi:PKD-like domain/FlgD Ig-like domain
MKAGSGRAHKPQWSLTSAAIGTIALVIGSAIAPATARAQKGTLGTPAGFQIDGQLYSGPTGDDWAQGNSFSGIFVGANRTPSILPSISFRDDHWAGSASDPTAFAGSSNKNNDYIGVGQSPWSTAPGSGPQKNDFTDIYVTSRLELVPGPPATTNVWVIVGGTTRAVNGDSHVDFEFNRAGIALSPNKPDHLVGNGAFGGRSIGDIILSVDYGTGGTNPTISIRRWQEVVPATIPPSYAYIDVTPTSAGSHYAAVDTTGFPTGPWGGIAPDGSFIPAGSNMVALQYFEGAVNLTAAGIVPSDLCSAVSTMTVKSRSSTSFTAELKDYALVPFTIVSTPTSSITGPGHLCAGITGATYSVTTNAVSPGYLWSITGNGTIIGSATGSSVIVNAGAAGSFNLSVNVTSSGLCGSPCNTSVTVNPNPTVTVAPVTVCASALPARLTAVGSGGTGPYTFSWSGPGGFKATGNPISVSTPGTYNVTMTDASSTHCTGTGSGTLTVNPNPTVTVAPVTVCASALPATLTAVAAGGTGPYTCSWSGPGGFTATGNAISVSTPGTYNVTVADASSTTCPATGSGTLTVNPNPAITATGDALSCFKTCGQLTASSTPPGATYSWTGPNGFASPEQNPAVCDSGTFTVTVTTGEGCTGSATAHVSIAIPTVGPCGSSGPVTSGFELDGDAFATSPNPPGDDWNLVFDGSSAAILTTGIVSDFPSKKDDYFQIGTKDQDDVTSWRYNVQSTPDKDDILHGGAAQYNNMLYFFGDRFDVSGDAQIGFWFLKDTVNVVVPGSTFTGKHSIGDLLVLSNFINGGGTPVIFAYEWVGSGGSDGPLNKQTLSESNSFAIVNTTAITSPWDYKAKGKVPSKTIPAGALFEGGIDLGCLTGAGVSACFSNFILETRSSASVTASLKDFLIGRFSASGQASVATVLKSEETVGPLQSLEVPQPAAALPIEFALQRIFPNPFRGSTVIRYALPEASSVSLKVFNVHGQHVATLVSGREGPGYRSVNWNARDRAGRQVPAGVYFYRLEATGLNSGASHVQLRKMLMLK